MKTQSEIESELIEKFKSMKSIQIYGKLRKHYKSCSCCNIEKSLFSFYSFEHNSFSSRCKMCYNKSNKIILEKQIDQIVNTKEINDLVQILVNN